MVKRVRYNDRSVFNPTDKEILERLIKMFDINVYNHDWYRHGVILLALETAIIKCYPSIKDTMSRTTQTDQNTEQHDSVD